MTLSVADPLAQQRLQALLRTIQTCHSRARVHLRSHPTEAQQLLDQAYEGCLSALEHCRVHLQDDSSVHRAMRQWMHTQMELDPRALDDHTRVLRIARETLNIHRLHQAREEAGQVVRLELPRLLEALELAYGQTSKNPLPDGLQDSLLLELGHAGGSACWVRPAALGRVLREALRQGRASASSWHK